MIPIIDPDDFMTPAHKAALWLWTTVVFTLALAAGVFGTIFLVLLIFGG